MLDLLGGLLPFALSHLHIIGAVAGIAGSGLTNFIPGLGQYKLIALAALVALVGIGFGVEEFRIANLRTDVATEHALAADWKGKYEGADAREKAVLVINTGLSDKLNDVTADLARFQKRAAAASAALVEAKKTIAAQTETLLQRIADHETERDHAAVPDGMRFTLISLLDGGDGGAPAVGPGSTAGGKTDPGGGRPATGALR